MQEPVATGHRFRLPINHKIQIISMLRISIVISSISASHFASGIITQQSLNKVFTNKKKKKQKHVFSQFVGVTSVRLFM